MVNCIIFYRINFRFLKTITNKINPKYDEKYKLHSESFNGSFYIIQLLER